MLYHSHDYYPLLRDLQESSVHEESSAIQRLREDLRICQTELRYATCLGLGFYSLCKDASLINIINSYNKIQEQQKKKYNLI